MYPVKPLFLDSQDLQILLYCIHNLKPNKTTFLNKVVYPEALNESDQPGKSAYRYKWYLDKEKDFNKFSKILLPLKINSEIKKL